MQRVLGKGIENPQEMVNFLSDNCDSIEQKGYMKRFSPEQLLKMKEELSETAIEINDLQEAKKEAVKEFGSQLKPLLEEKKMILKGLKHKSEHVMERCFKFIDEEKREVGFYSETGELIESRPAYADELQMNIFQVIKKNGTENE
jgi:phenylalanyl-tRNA synthetase alpha subunit